MLLVCIVLFKLTIILGFCSADKGHFCNFGFFSKALLVLMLESTEKKTQKIAQSLFAKTLEKYIVLYEGVMK